MLWLPRWLSDENPPEAAAEGVSRRTFLFMGASAVVAAAVPAKVGLCCVETVTPMEGDAYVAYFHRQLYARITVPRHMMLIDGITGRPFAQAMRLETASALAEVNAEAKAAGFTLGPGRWEDADGNVLFNVSDAQRRFMEDS